MDHAETNNFYGNAAGSASRDDDPSAWADRPVTTRVKIGLGKRSRGRVVTREESFHKFSRRLRKPRRTSETLAEYMALSIEAQDALKAEAGFWVGGVYTDGRRKREFLEARTVLTLDLDHPTPELFERLLANRTALAGLEHCIHTTRKHSPEAPRVRVSIPFSRLLLPDEYEPVARIVAEEIDPTMDAIDHVSFRAAQAMYNASCSADSEFRFRYFFGEPIDPDAKLAGFRQRTGLDPFDLAALPYSARQGKAKARAKKAEDPRGKAGIIGAFCRAVPIEEAFVRFLFEVYEEGSEAGRWSFIGGTTTNGIVFYDALFAMSFHTSDPLAGRLVNSFDAVRIVLFGDRDADAVDGTAMHDLPSFRAMDELARSLPEVMAELEADGWERPRVDPNEAFADADVASDGDDEPTIGGFALDHDGVIRSFERRYGKRLRFDHDAGKWLRFVGSHWRRESTKLALHYARESSLALAKANPTSSAVKALKNVPTWEAIERGARADRTFAVSADTWDRDPMLLGTPGGTVNLTTGELRPADPADYISKVTAVAPIPLEEFDPTQHCPTWMAFLSEALAGDDDAIRFLQQWGGYSLTGDTREQVLVFVYGPGGSGKGTAINTIGDILADYSVNVGMETLTASKHDRHTTELARLRGARMARASETEKGRALAENRIKGLTGQDRVTARFMRQDDFEFRPEFKLTIIGNNQPALKDVDAAIKRRFIVVPFDHPPAVKDETLPERLRAEWPGILSWLIRGCLDWQANGLQRPRVVEAATAAYFTAQDDFGRWIEDACEVVKGAVEKNDALWESLQRHTNANGFDIGSKNKWFPEMMKQRGFAEVKDTAGIRGRGWGGLRLREGEGKDNERFN